MANILEFLRGVLTDPETQAAYRADPEGFTVRSGFADLTGEDVVEAVAMLRRSLPDEVAASLGDFEDDDRLAGARTAVDERDLDAALRMLDHAVGSVGAGSGGEANGDGATAEDEAGAAAPAAAAEDDGDAGPTAADEGDAHDEPILVESELDVTAGGPGSIARPLPTMTPVALDLDGLPSAAPFAEALAGVAADASEKLGELLDIFQSDLELQMTRARDRFAEVLRQAEADADDLRRSAQDEASRLQAEAYADREAARTYLDRTKQEADDLLERARAHADDTRQQADELLVAARAEDAAVRAELRSRKDAMRSAEREMKERLAGLDSIFRSVLDDDEEE